MTDLDFFGGGAWRPLVLGLLHTLWQGALIALLLTAALRRLRADQREARYLLALSAQFCVLVAGLATWSWLALPAVPPSSLGFVRTDQPRPSAPVASVVEDVATDDRNPPTIVPASDPLWIPVLAAGWVAGVVLTSINNARSVFAARRLSRGPLLDEPAMAALLDRLRGELGIRRPVRMIACDALTSPAVLGVIRPTLLLPVSLMTGLPAEALQAILAHELAHVRRHDDLANLAQILIETVLFFNPTVWWLGRQVRIEREACCDALAVGVVGDRLVYSRALAAWARRTASSLAVAAWSGDGRPSTVVERIRRVLRPADRFGPQRISLGGLMFLLAVGPILLALAWKGTQAAVVLAAQALTPAQRVEKIEQARERFGIASQSSSGQAGKAVLKGTIRRSDGDPLGAKVRLGVLVFNGNSTTMAAAGSFDDFFSVASQAGTIWILVDPDDYAPALVGPFDGRPGRTIDDVAIVLDPGFSHRVRVLDEEGRPIAGAQVNGNLFIQGGWSGSGAGWTTDADGVATIPHAAAGAYGFSISAVGFQTPEAGLRATVKPEGETTFTLQHARVTRGVVVDQEDRPVAEAVVRIAAEHRIEGVSRSYGGFGPTVGKTDSEGRFQVDTLRNGPTYLLFIEAGDDRRGFIPGVQPGRLDLRAVVVSCPPLEGRIIGDLTSLERNSGTPVIWQSQATPAGTGSDPMMTRLSWRAAVDPNGGFKLEHLVPGELTVRAGSHVWRRSIPETKGPLVLDMSATPTGPAERRVVLRVVSAEGAAPATGLIGVHFMRDELAVDRRVELHDGRAVFEAPVGVRASYRIETLAGFWFPSGEAVVEPGEGEQVVEARAVAAGAIVGRVVTPDGALLVENVNLSCKAVQPPPGLEHEYLHVNNLRPDASGRFFVSPLPLGGVYVVVATRGHAPRASNSIRLDGVNPTAEIEIRLQPPISASGRVLDPDGRPLAEAPVSLVLEDPVVGTSWGPPVLTGRDGGFRFDDLAADTAGYVVRLDFRRDFQPIRASLQPGGESVTIQVQRGRRLEGRVLEASTGRPIPGVAFYAMSHTPGDPKSYRRFEPESVSDANGRFRFSNLPDQPIELNDGDGLKWEAPTSRAAHPDKTPPIVVRATLPTWSQLRPSPPKD